MAVQGKLVPQNPDDEPASVLLQRIKTEKEELIKQGKIKKNKKSSEIFRGASRNLPYAYCEQIGKEIQDISDEIPFDIPDSWEWCRFNDLYSLSNGTASRGSKEGIEYPVLRLADISCDSIDLSNIRVIRLTEKEYTSHQLQKDDIILIRVNGSKDRVATAYYYNGTSTISYCDHLFCGHRTSCQVYARFIMYLFNSAIIRTQIIPEIKTTAGQNTVSQSSLNQILIPIPPLAEQHRIVSKIEELLPYIEKYGAAETKLSTLNTTFPEALKKSILQEAVQGKLVPQNPDDEPASVLLERIRAEKQELIKAGKIKKDKHESVIQA